VIGGFLPDFERADGALYVLFVGLGIEHGKQGFATVGGIRDSGIP